MKSRTCLLSYFLGVFLLVAGVALNLSAEAGENNNTLELKLDNLNSALEDLDTQLEQINAQVEVITNEGNSTVSINLGNSGSKAERPMLGVYLADLTFGEAYKMHYNECYGVRLSGVTSSGAARQAGLMEDDIIMEFDGVKVISEDQLSRLIRSKNVGDQVVVKYFRDENVHTTTVVLQSSRPESDEEEEIDVETGKPVITVGDGGGSWYPVWFMPDFTDLNYVLNEQLHFTPLDDSGLLLNGFGGKGNVGKGWFLGGMGAWYTTEKSKRIANGNAIRRMRFKIGYGGVTLDRRFALSRRLVPSLGVMLGWGGYSVTVNQTDGDFTWSTLDADLNASENNHLQMQRRFIIIQPKAAFLLRLTDWLALQVEGGYMLGYSFNGGWQAVVVEDKYEINGSPDTSWEGWSVTVGPWFGF